MAEKRKRSDGVDVSTDRSKKPKRGFTVGPQNLPDGVYKRKNQEIKQSLIDRAKIKKTYAKLKAQSTLPINEEETLPIPASAALDSTILPSPPSPTNTPHPDRQTLINAPSASPEPRPQQRQHRQRRPKPTPFAREHAAGQRLKAEAAERRAAREKAALEKARALEEREKFRSAMAKARTGGRNGQRKLGRESLPLLERVRRMMGAEGK